MGSSQGLRDRHRHREPVLGGNSIWEESFKGLALDEFQDEVLLAVLLDEVVDLADVGVVQLREEAGFLKEAASGGRRDRNTARQGLDSNGSAEAFIEGSIHLSHATPAEQLLHPKVIPDLSALKTQEAPGVKVTGSLQALEVETRRTQRR